MTKEDSKTTFKISSEDASNYKNIISDFKEYGNFLPERKKSYKIAVEDFLLRCSDKLSPAQSAEFSKVINSILSGYERLNPDQRINYNKVAVSVLNGLKMTAAAKLFYAELSDIYESTDEKKLFNKCRHLVHEFCKFRNGDEYEVCKINAAHGGAQDVYIDSLAFERDKFLTKEEMQDYSYMGDLANSTFDEINKKKDASIENGISARTAIKCAKKIMENQVFLIPDVGLIEEAIEHLKTARKRAKKGTMDMIAVVEALQAVSDDSKVDICRANVLIDKHRFENR